MSHRDAYRIVTPGHCGRSQAIPLCSQDQGQLVLRHQARVLNADCPAVQSQGRCPEAQLFQPFQSGPGPLGGVAPNPGPRDLEDSTHTYPDRPAMERVAAGRGDQHAVQVQRRRRTEDRPHIGRVHDPLQDGDSAGAGAHLLHPGQYRTSHGTQHPPGEVIAGQRRQNLVVRGVDRHLPAPLYKSPPRSLQMFVSHQQGDGLTAAVQSMSDHFGALRDKDPLFRLSPATKLPLC